MENIDQRKKINAIEKDEDKEIALDSKNTKTSEVRKILKIKRQGNETGKPSFGSIDDDKSTVPDNQFKLVKELPKFKFNFVTSNEQKTEEEEKEKDEGIAFKPIKFNFELDKKIENNKVESVTET